MKGYLCASHAATFSWGSRVFGATSSRASCLNKQSGDSIPEKSRVELLGMQLVDHQCG